MPPHRKDSPTSLMRDQEDPNSALLYAIEDMMGEADKVNELHQGAWHEAYRKIAAKCFKNSAESSDDTLCKNLRSEYIYIPESYEDSRYPSVPCER